MASPLPRLTTALSDRYRIERDLGAVGMATVCRADDLRHGRHRHRVLSTVPRTHPRLMLLPVGPGRSRGLDGEPEPYSDFPFSPSRP